MFPGFQVEMEHGVPETGAGAGGPDHEDLPAAVSVGSSLPEPQKQTNTNQLKRGERLCCAYVNYLGQVTGLARFRGLRVVNRACFLFSFSMLALFS